MKVLIFRHAERENSGGSNPPLSQKGLKQAEKIRSEIEDQHLPMPTKLLASPKLRAQQTFSQMASGLGLTLHTHSDLDERVNFESPTVFSKRVQNYLAGLEKLHGVTYLVTHLDWLEEAMRLIHSDVDLTTDRFQSWMPAQSIEFEIQDRLWIFQKLRFTL